MYFLKKSFWGHSLAKTKGVSKDGDTSACFWYLYYIVLESSQVLVKRSQYLSFVLPVCYVKVCLSKRSTTPSPLPPFLCASYVDVPSISFKEQRNQIDNQPQNCFGVEFRLYIFASAYLKYILYQRNICLRCIYRKKEKRK